MLAIHRVVNPDVSTEVPKKATYSVAEEYTIVVAPTVEEREASRGIKIKRTRVKSQDRKRQR